MKIAEQIATKKGAFPQQGTLTHNQNNYKKIYRLKNEKNHYLFFLLDTSRRENVAKLLKYFSETF